MCKKDGWVIFKNSELLCGELGKVTMGESKTGLMYALIRDNSTRIAITCMRRVAKLSARWLSNYGMSIGIGDVTPDTEVSKKKEIIMMEGEKECDKLISLFKDDKLEREAGCDMAQSLESKLNKELG